MLLIVYEKFTMSGSLFRFLAFCDQIDVQIFPNDILHLLWSLQLIFLNIWGNFPCLFCNLFWFIFIFDTFLNDEFHMFFVSVLVCAAYVLTGSHFVSCFCKVRRLFLKILWRMWKIKISNPTKCCQSVCCNFIVLLDYSMIYVLS